MKEVSSWWPSLPGKHRRPTAERKMPYPDMTVLGDDEIYDEKPKACLISDGYLEDVPFDSVDLRAASL